MTDSHNARQANGGMNVVFLCDDEPFNIPNTVQQIITASPHHHYTIVSFAGHGSIGNFSANLNRYMSLFGILRFPIKLAGFIRLKLLAWLNVPTRIPHSLSQVSSRLNVEHFRLQKINSDKIREQLKALDPDVFISIACPEILKRKTLEIPRLGCWNVHSSLLPRNRGMMPSFWSLYKGDQPGVTFHRMVRDVDAGEILLSREIDASIKDTTLEQLLWKSKNVAASLIVRGLAMLEAGKVELKPNPAAEATVNFFPTVEDVRKFREMGGRITGKWFSRPLVGLSFDVEEWFQTSAAGRWYPAEKWDGMQSRVPIMLKKVLDLLDEYEARATFFVLGWIIEKYPDSIQQISDRGHEIASHGYGHTELTKQPEDDFRRDLDLFREIVNKKLHIPEPVGFRAPSFSVVRETLWAIDEIVEHGYRYDSSVYPMFRHRYGMPEAPFEPHLLSGRRHTIVEMPLASISILHFKVPVAGGAYMRFYPGPLHRFLLRAVSRRGRVPILYVHPWEIDSINMSHKMNWLQRFRQHHNSGQVSISRLSRILQNYKCVTLRSLAEDVPGYLSDAAVASIDSTEGSTIES